MTKQAIQQEALSRAASGNALTNYPAIYQGFIDKGIAEDEIKPRINIFTYEAWRALGRQVRKGEHGVKILTYIESVKKDRDSDTGEEKQVSYRRPWHTTVFHVSQTDPITPSGKGVN